jgi:small subunit ribosomal protein S2
MKDLLETGVHFGHRTNRWDPRMKSYIFTERNGIHIVDLQQTVERLKEAYNLIRDTVADGGNILFVGTKRQAQETIQMEAQRCGMPYVVERWLPGTLTNWSTIYARIMELERLEKMRESGEMDRLIKKEQLGVERQINRLLVHLSGIRDMNGLPSMLFVVDIMREYTAVHEANLKGVPVVAMVDTNCDPTNIDYLIPSNDDAIRAIKLIVNKMAEAVLEGKAMRKEDEPEMDQKPIGEDEMRVRAAISLEDDVDDEDLLGDTVLKKLEKSRLEKAEKEEEEAEAVSEGEEDEETVEDEPSDESVEAVEESVVEESEPEVVEEPVEEPKAEEPAIEQPKEEAEKVEDQKIEELDLGTRTNNLLLDAKIKKVSQLVKKLEKDPDALENISGIGPKTADDILKKLKKLGFSFKK